tara:strand:- start:2327 stop:2896 length:570 start_codon:yes stop_codon:yes gene_type:complete
MKELDHTGSAQHELEHTVHSTKTLIKASAFAAIFGALVLIFTILPAEYNIDPTGVGATLGLTKLANAKEVKPVMSQSKLSAGEFQEHSTSITVDAGAGLEYKFNILKGDAVRYAWNTEGDALFFDFHGEPKGDTTGFFESYTVSTANQVRGTFTAPFDGSHGWYWKNKGSVPVTVSLQVEGNFELIGVK